MFVFLLVKDNIILTSLLRYHVSNRCFFSDGERDVSRHRKTSDNSSESAEDRALPSSDSDDAAEASPPSKPKKKRVVSSGDEESDARTPPQRSDSD